MPGEVEILNEVPDMATGQYVRYCVEAAYNAEQERLSHELKFYDDIVKPGRVDQLRIDHLRLQQARLAELHRRAINTLEGGGII